MTVELEPRPAATLPPIDPLAAAIADIEGLPETAPELSTDGDVATKELDIIFYSGELERVWATMILASTAAAMGVRCRVFVTFWGLQVFVKNQRRITGENWMQKMMSFMQRPGISHRKLSKMDFLGVGPWMMGKLAKQYNVASPTELLQMASDLGVEFIPCQMTMDMFGLKQDDLIDGMGDPAGAATAIEIMTQANASLFI